VKKESDLLLAPDPGSKMTAERGGMSLNQKTTGS